MLLRFRVANHRSIRDEQELSLVEVPKRGEGKPKAGEIPPTVQVAGIYGSNASGKSNVLDALRWMRMAVHDSYTRWAPEGGVPRDPFALDDEARGVPSFFEVDLVHEGVRYTYGFEVDSIQVVGEWLFAYPHGRAQRWFEREVGEDGEHVYHFGRALKGEVERMRKLTRGNSLYISVAATSGHPELSDIYQELALGVASASQDPGDQDRRIALTKQLIARSGANSDLFRLAQVADLGITGWRLGKKDVPESVKRNLPVGGGDEFPEYLKRTAPHLLERRLILERCVGDEVRLLDFDNESEGTKSWISLIGPLINILRTGSAFLVDEIDSSLHPRITSTVIKMFQDPEVNSRGAQLIFASHDTTLLGGMLEGKLLKRDEVWFTEKDAEGATQLFSLAEFYPRGEENTERGYLQGRYGAVPYVDFEDIRLVFVDLHRELDEPPAEGKGEPLSEYANP